MKKIINLYAKKNKKCTQTKKFEYHFPDLN